MFLYLFILLTTFIFFLFFKYNYGYWRRKGIAGPKSTNPFGNIAEILFAKKTIGELYANIYNQFPEAPIVGAYRAITPILILRDPNIIKEVTVREFSHFTDNDFDVDMKIDPLLGKNPFVLKGEHWKVVRSQLTPYFTIGKIKMFVPLIEEKCRGLINYIRSETRKSESIEGKDVCGKFTLENVGICAFGLEAECYANPNSEFIWISKFLNEMSRWDKFKAMLVFLFPQMAKVLSVRVFSEALNKKIQDIITQTLKYRKKKNIFRNDFLDSMDQLKKSCTSYKFTNLDIAAHAGGFLLDGYETSSTAMSFILFELAENLDCQSKLREEINEKILIHNQISYEVLQEMEYLDAVVNESLRMHPPLPWLMKVCTSAYTFEIDDKSVRIEKNTPIVIPLYGIQRDPKYFPNPDIFTPERFIGKNKEQITKYTYMPFGEGPRSCLGKRFGVMQIKLGLVYIIKNFVITISKKTQKSLKLEQYTFVVGPAGGVWLNFKEINE